jgi:hypothetical protein
LRAVTQRLHGGHRRLEPVDQTRPRLADRLLDADPWEGKGRERIAVWGKRPAHESDTSPQRDDGSEDVVAMPAVEGALVKLVDLALDLLDQEEVADQYLVDERGDQVAGGQDAEERLPVDAVAEPLERLDASVMDGQDDVPPGEKIDLTADESGRGLVLGLDRLERDVDHLGGAREPGSTGVGGQPFEVRVGQADGVDHLADLALFDATVDVDPQEPLLAE